MSKNVFLIIDPQNDFHGGGSLAVGGADEDAVRIADLVRKNVRSISGIFTTLDSHHKEHIAHALFWSSTADGKGSEPQPFQSIAHQDLIDGKWFPKDSSLMEYCIGYTKKLEEKGRFKLTIWPQHCIIGTKGQDIVDAVKEAIEFWQEKTSLEPVYIYKGMNNLTEMYSAIEAEVPLDNDIHTQANMELVAKLKEADKVYICGQAKSHCVNYTARDLLKYWGPRQPADLIVIEDAASAVYGCQEAADLFISDMRSAGATIMSAAKAMEDLKANK